MSAAKKMLKKIDLPQSERVRFELTHCNRDISVFRAASYSSSPDEYHAADSQYGTNFDAFPIGIPCEYAGIKILDTMTFPELIQSDKPVLVDFTATWCGPCKMMTPILEEVKSSFGDRITIVKIDVDKNQAVSSQFEVQSVPTLIIFKEGKVKWRQSGVIPAKELEQVLNNV
jgi:thioredoxin 1